MGEELIRFCVLALVCVAAGLVVGQVRPEFSGLLRIGGSILLFGAMAIPLSERIGEVSGLLGETRIGPYAVMMLRSLGIAFLTVICANVCRDCGENTVASGVETAGKLAIVSLCIPLIGEILGFAFEILEAA